MALSHQSLNQIFLFTDGNPTSGETNWLKIQSNIAEKIRDLNFQISSFTFGDFSREVHSLAGMAGGKTTYFTKGDWQEINVPKDKMAGELQQKLKRGTHLAAINVQLQIEIAPEINILHFYGHRLLTDPAERGAVTAEIISAEEEVRKYLVEPLPALKDRGIRVFVPNLAFGETYWLVFELAIPLRVKTKSLNFIYCQKVAK